MDAVTDQLPSLVERRTETRWVQSCITAVGFPDSLAGVLELVGKNGHLKGGGTDLDALLRFRPETAYFWSVPRWMTTGDIVFFYHTKRAKLQIARLQRELALTSRGQVAALTFPPILWEGKEKLAQILAHAAEQAERYSGTIFACGLVGGPAERWDAGTDGHHFRGRIFAELADVHVFAAPISYDELSDVIRIQRRATTTPLAKADFDWLGERLAGTNAIPAWLQDATFGELGFRDVNRSNWLSISCAPQARFVNETQVRAYYLDYLLDEVKDSRTPLLRECQCFRHGQLTGIVDYCVKIHGRWVPVEAKLSVRTERDLPAQVQKYIHVESFKPTKAPNKGRSYDQQDSPLCLVADETGVYVTWDSEFAGCDGQEPLWPRSAHDTATATAIRTHLRPLVAGM